jgi:hypothetical protein
MSTIEDPRSRTGRLASDGSVGTRLEVVSILFSDTNRAKEFYGGVPS